MTLTAFNGTFTFSGFSAGGTADVVGDLLSWSDQTNQYFANNIAVGDQLWDNLGNLWEVAVVNSSTLTSANVDLTDVNSAGGTPFGIGSATRNTPNVGLTVFPPDNSIGISQQLKSRMETHNMLTIDAFVAAITGGAKVFYDSGLGFNVFGTSNTAVTTNPSTGNYTITVPADDDLDSVQKEFTNAGTDFTGGGDAVITIVWNRAGFNTSLANAIIPNVKIIDSAGTQREPADVGVTISTTAAGGSTVTTIAGINGVGVPVRIKLDF